MRLYAYNSLLLDTSAAVAELPSRLGRRHITTTTPYLHPAASTTRFVPSHLDNPNGRFPTSYYSVDLLAPFIAHNLHALVVMSNTIQTTRLGTNSQPSADWQLASRRAQDRIVQLQEQRAREASGSVSRIRSFFSGDSVKPSFRVGQLDTELLDEELLDLLKGQLWGGLKYFRVSIHEFS